MKNFGPVVLLNYGSGSVKRNGIYDLALCTICYPAGYLDLKPEDITEILKESM